MSFSVDDFNEFLGESGPVGQTYIWYRADPCPCADAHSGAGRQGCPMCSGKGVQFAAGQGGVAAMASSRTQREWAQFGTYEQGDVVVTIPENSPLYDVGQYDRVTATDSIVRFGEVLEHGSGALEVLPFLALSITRVFWLNEDETANVDGGIPTIAEDGSLSWPEGGEPPADTQYTVTGTKYLEYICLGNFPTNRAMGQGLRLPRKVVLRDSDLFKR